MQVDKNRDKVSSFIGGYHQKPVSGIRRKAYEIIFESDTKAGRAFDVWLLVVIVLSVLVVMLDSIPWIHYAYRKELYLLEWLFTILFTIEYILRLWCVDRKKGYIRSMYGILDLVAILPTYISLFLVGAQYLLVVRSLRLLRIFRIFKMTRYLTEGAQLWQAMYQSSRKISVFFLFIITLVMVLGSVMYLIEGPEHGFVSIPESIYWAIVTLTTVGYGDISPQTSLGKFLASIVMLCGYAIIAVPTGIVTSEIARISHVGEGDRKPCKRCGETANMDARYCSKCGERLADTDKST